MSNGYDKVFMYDAGRKALFEFNTESSINYDPVVYGSKEKLCNDRDCIYKFDS